MTSKVLSECRVRRIENSQRVSLVMSKVDEVRIEYDFCLVLADTGCLKVGDMFLSSKPGSK